MDAIERNTAETNAKQVLSDKGAPGLLRSRQQARLDELEQLELEKLKAKASYPKQPSGPSKRYLRRSTNNWTTLQEARQPLVQQQTPSMFKKPPVINGTSLLRNQDHLLVNFGEVQGFHGRHQWNRPYRGAGPNRNRTRPENPESQGFHAWRYPASDTLPRLHPN